MSLRFRKLLVSGAVLAGAVSFGVGIPTAVHAQEFVSASVEGVDEERDVPEEVLEEETERTDVAAEEAETEVLAETAERGLAVTGTDAATLVALGAASVALGGVALAARRRNANA